MIEFSKSSPIECKDIIHVYFLYCPIRTGHFGPGTFLSKLVGFLGADVKVTLVSTDDRDAIEVGFGKIHGIDAIRIPRPQSGRQLTADDMPMQHQYAQRVVDILRPYLPNSGKVLFWINSADYLNVADCLKQCYSQIKILYVHHAWAWKHLLNVSDAEFDRRWKSGDHSSNPFAFKLTDYQRRMSMLSDVAVAVTSQAATFLVDTLGVSASKVRFIANGSEGQSRTLTDRDELLAKYGFKREDRIILFIGRVKQDKGVAELIKAVGLLLRKYSNIKLVIVGDGDFGKFIPLASPFWSQVVYTGELDKSQIHELHFISEIGVVPSLHEQCSFSAIEMRFAKLPLVVSDVDGLSEMFVDEYDALKVNVEYSTEGFRQLSIDGLAGCIQRLLDDKLLCKSISDNGYEVAEKYYSVECMREKYKSAMKSLFDQRNIDPEDDRIESVRVIGEG